MKKVFLTGFIGSKNLGDEAIFETLVSQLKKLPVHLTVATLDEVKTRRLVPDTVRANDFWAITKCIRECDYVFLGGGGLLQDETSVFNVPGHLWRLWLAKFFRKPILMIAIGVGPLISGVSRWLVKRTCASAALITVRDQESSQLLMDLGVDSKKVHVVTDPAVSFPLPQKENNHPVALTFPEGGYIVVSFREISHGSNRWLPVSLKHKFNKIFRGPGTVDIFKQIAETLDEIADRFKLKILFFPFLENRDEIIHQQILQHMRFKQSAQMFEGEPTPQAFCALVKHSRFVVSMRLHACILAARMNIPAIGLSYAPKVRSFFKSLGLNENCLETQQFSRESALRLVERLLKNEIEIKRILSGRTVQLSQLNEKNIQLIAREMKV